MILLFDRGGFSHIARGATRGRMRISNRIFTVIVVTFFTTSHRFSSGRMVATDRTCIGKRLQKEKNDQCGFHGYSKYNPRVLILSNGPHRTTTKTLIRK